MAKGSTWLWIIVGFIAVCVVSLLAIAGAGVYFVSHHIAVKRTTSADALRAFDEARAAFQAQQPLLEMDVFDRPREVRRLADLPTSPVKPVTLHVLVWNPDEERLARVALPFWLLRLGRRRIDVMNRQSFNFERLNLDVPELERIGPALVLDYRPPSGERVLIWTQ